MEPSGKKFDSAKLRLDLVDPNFIIGVGEILTMGADKYGPNNWQNLTNFNDRYYSALMRHLMAWRNGEKIDPESGLSHLKHIAVNTMFLLWKEEQE